MEIDAAMSPMDGVLTSPARRSAVHEENDHEICSDHPLDHDIDCHNSRSCTGWRRVGPAEKGDRWNPNDTCADTDCANGHGAEVFPANVGISIAD
jgi:hypothetical protein